MRIPSEIVSGDSISWVDEPFSDNLQNDIAPPDWSLRYAFRGPSTLDLVAVSYNGHWKTSATAAQTADLPAGVYYWQAFAINGANRVTYSSGQLTVKANLVDQEANFDGRSQAKKDLDSVQSAIRAIISGGAVQRYTIGNRSVDKMSLSDLYSIETRLKFQVAQENRAQMIKQGLGDPNTLKVRFK